MSKWSPSPDDVRELCEFVLENYIATDSNTGGDYCKGCGMDYGNVALYKGSEPHRSSCVVKVAQDVMTGIPNV